MLGILHNVIEEYKSIQLVLLLISDFFLNQVTKRQKYGISGTMLCKKKHNILEKLSLLNVYSIPCPVSLNAIAHS